MSLSPELNRRLPRWLAPLGALAAAVLMASCGGGTSQVQAFKPDRVVVLGDETSLIADATDAEGKHDGFKYTINDRTSTSTGKCTALPTFAQAVANLYGFAFKECNPNSATVKAVTYAAENATVGDIAIGLEQQAATASLGSKDMVTVMIGLHDVIEVYEKVKNGTWSESTAITEIKARGRKAASVMNNVILKSGARALLFTIPDLGLSPYAVTEQLSRSNAKALLSQLTYDYNAEMRAGIDATAYDGRNYGLVLVDDLVSAVYKAPTAYLASPASPDVAACDKTQVTAPQCTTATLVSGASSTSHLWADDIHLGPQAHSLIGSQAQTRALNNPF
ncbi:SGNH/GDSL hydrolase family protein [Ideonella sp. DXS22W]|uniref:SGNH/GDSL hydrolase family protein n=1 Tax=Pseudaquabacterium inlustre TaxID=2984192 RepID=A0ABU9CNW8_9BURK